jgi:hypothetical protein
MALLETATAYILGIITENEEVKKFPREFVSASMRWISSWFLEDDPVTKSIVENAALPEAVKKPVVEAKLNVLKDNPAFMAELATQLQTYAQHQSTRKNIIEQAEIDIKGNVHIGDKDKATNENYDEKNIIKGGSLKAGGDFRLGDGI